MQQTVPDGSCAFLPTRYERENPGVPVVRNVEDIWMVAKVEQMKKARAIVMSTMKFCLNARVVESLQTAWAV